MDKKLVLVVLVVLLVIGIPLSTYGAVANNETNGVHRVPASHLPNASQQGPTADAASNATVAGTISLTEPVGLWFPGSTHAISWNYTGYIGNHVKVSLYKDGQFVQELEKFMSAIVPVNSHHQYSHTFNSITGNNVYNIRVRVESTSNAHIYKHAYIRIEYR